jgi:lipoprotein NlpD
VKHNDDYLTAYAHNQVILVKEKQQLKARQKIAKMGNTDAKSVGLRFEVRYRGKSVNPLYYLPR